MKVNNLIDDIMQLKSSDDYFRLYGIEDIQEYLRPTGKYLDDYNSYSYIEDGLLYIDMIKTYKDKICILVDSDLDGFMSASLVYKFLIDVLEYNAEDIIPIFHIEKQHGLSNDIKIPKCKYLWIPDAGSNDVNQCNELSNNGIHILITDHHQCDYDNPEAIVINNQLSKKVCNKELCGTGVTYKLLQAYCKSIHSDWHKKVLDMIAIANIADSESVSSYENRTFNYYGLNKLRNDFVKHMTKSFADSEYLNPEMVSWNIAPKINALCRSDNQELKLKTFIALATGEYDSNSLIDELLEVHKHQTYEVSKLFEKMKQQSPIIINGIHIYDIGENTPYTGLVANKLLSYTKSPVIVVHTNENGFVGGSVRSPIPLRDILKDSNILSVCQGHDCSFGIGWDNHNTNSFFDFLTKVKLDFDPVEEVTMTVDNVLQIPNFLYQIADIYTDLWGKGFPAPSIYMHNLIINSNDIRVLGKTKRTLKFTVGMVDFIMFNATNEFKESLCIGQGKNITLDIIGNPSINHWNDMEYPQIQIQKIEII